MSLTDGTNGLSDPDRLGGALMGTLGRTGACRSSLGATCCIVNAFNNLESTSKEINFPTFPKLLPSRPLSQVHRHRGNGPVGQERPEASPWGPVAWETNDA